jgi:aminoglycoside/choline kinase family phosphotransferase
VGREATLTPAQAAFVRGHVDGFAEEGWSITTAGHAGSSRVFLRIRETAGRGRTYILVVWDGSDGDWPRFLKIPEEVGTFVSFLPKIHAFDRKAGLVLEEDLGECTLNRAVSGTRGGRTAVIDVYCRALFALSVWQSLDIKASPTIASRAMDMETFLWESGYFARRCVVDFCGCGKALNGAWEKDRRALARDAASLPRTFIHRDFQSENILLNGSEVRFVDYQGARLGPPAYDVASLLYDPYVDFLGGGMTARFFEYYRSRALRVKSGQHDFDVCAVQRLMQACGAYGNLSVHRGKARYRSFIPAALARLAGVLEQLPEYPSVKKLVECCRDAVRGTHPGTGERFPRRD